MAACIPHIEGSIKTLRCLCWMMGLWCCLIAVPLQGQCYLKAVPIQIDNTPYKKISDVHDYARMIFVEDGNIILNYAMHIDLYKIDKSGKVIKKMAYADLEIIANQLINKWHGKDASLKKVLTKEDSLATSSRASFWFRNIRRLEGSDEFLVQVSAKVNDGKMSYWESFSKDFLADLYVLQHGRLG